MSERTRSLALRWFNEVWNEKRSDTIGQLVHPECVGHHEGQTTRGVEDIQAMRDQLLMLVPDLEVRVDGIVVDAENAVVRWTFSGRNSGGSRQPISFSGMTWLKFSGDQIVEGWDRWNQAAFLQQLAL
jgi:predicted ester cyclase